MTYYANVFFDFLFQKSLAGTLPATLAPFADRFTRLTADLANARLRPFCALHTYLLYQIANSAAAENIIVEVPLHYLNIYVDRYFPVAVPQFILTPITKCICDMDTIYRGEN